MKVQIKNQNEVKNVGDAFVFNNPNMLYSDNLIVKAEGGTIVACGFYDAVEDRFDLLDVDLPAYLITEEIENVLNLINDEELDEIGTAVEFSID